MPPEVCLGKPYDHKADVWALGVILYELITFKKPFDGATVHAVFERTVKHRFNPLPEHTDINLTLLVSALLNKDYNKRPNVLELTKNYQVRKAILKFVEEHNCREEV